MNFHFSFTRSEAEKAWPDFLRWLGFSAFTEALERKHASLAEWSAFQDIAPKLFSIEFGLAKILKRWKSTRRLSFPDDKETYEALDFVGLCMALKRQLSIEEADLFRRRLVSSLLPSGRLSHIDHEFRIAQNLISHGWKIQKHGFCGNPGPDFIAVRESRTVEVEGKCLSPEVGLGVSYEYCARLMSRISRDLQERYEDKFTTIRIELLGEFHEPNKIEEVKRCVIDAYFNFKNFVSGNLRITIEQTPLADLFSRFPYSEAHENWVKDTFQEIRTAKGDYGFFITKDAEMVFINLVPTRPNRQAKKVFRLISETCERQFSRSLPGILWLHLQALDPNLIGEDLEDNPDFFTKIAQHTFRNSSRSHIAAIALSTDSQLEIGRRQIGLQNARVAISAGKVRGFSNPNCSHGDFEPFNAELFGIIPLRAS
jgi:hypothetical protein